MQLHRSILHIFHLLTFYLQGQTSPLKVKTWPVFFLFLFFWGNNWNISRTNRDIFTKFYMQLQWSILHIFHFLTFDLQDQIYPLKVKAWPFFLYFFFDSVIINFVMSFEITVSFLHFYLTCLCVWKNISYIFFGEHHYF